MVRRVIASKSGETASQNSFSIPTCQKIVAREFGPKEERREMTETLARPVVPAAEERARLRREYTSNVVLGGCGRTLVAS